MTQASAARSHTFTFLNVTILPAKAAQLYTEQETYVTLSIDNRQQMDDEGRSWKWAAHHKRLDVKSEI